MVSFIGLNFSNMGVMLPGTSSSSTLVDVYHDLSEKKDEFVAVTLANDDKTDKRASATRIGAYSSLMFAGVKLGINLARKGKAYKDPLINWFMNGVNSYINFMTKHNIGKIPLVNKLLGVGTYLCSATLLGGILGYGFDQYSTAKNTKVNGKISNVKSGENGSWIQSGLKSLSATDEGKQIIKNSITKNDDDSITVKFNGINREYNITKKEMNDASRAYITYKSEDGQTVTGFKKKFSKGDGDVLAFEIAFEKYCKDLKDGIIPEDENLPKSLYKFFGNGDLLFTSGQPKQLYYLLTGKKSEKHNITTKNDSITHLYEKKNILNFIEKYKLKPKNYAVEVTLNDETSKKDNLKICDKYHVIRQVPKGIRYTIEHSNGKTVTLANADKTKDKIYVPFKNIEKYITEVNYVDLT